MNLALIPETVDGQAVTFPSHACLLSAVRFLPFVVCPFEAKGAMVKESKASGQSVGTLWRYTLCPPSVSLELRSYHYHRH